MQLIKKLTLSFALIVGLVAVPLAPMAVSAQSAASEMKDSVNKVGGGSGQTDFNQGIKSIVNMLLFLLGVLAVIMIIIGGFRYVISNGDSGAIKSAKDTILYAVVGLVVAILAYAIVNFIVGAFSGK